tara:strand:+ start:1090 stop:2358 length:1269 start_codon:yes stop_codon:yes gene_type:complete
MKNNLKLKDFNNLIEKHRQKNSKFKYPLLDDAFSNNDLFEGIKVIISGQLTMAKKTEVFEKKFAKKLKVKYAVMVNSGSSANLLSTFAACNPMRKNKFKVGDEVLIPSLCWPTSLWPLVQAGLKPKFVDIDYKTLNVRANDIIKSISTKTKVILLIHVLGNSTDMDVIREVAKKKKIILIEDTCESLGATYKKKYLGTFGDFGTYSFYYSHQISSGEGGMVVCNSFNDYQLLLSMRAHGWSRNLKLHKNIERKYPNLDKRFVFVNSGFNLRPTDVAASIGNSQFSRLNTFIKIRKENRAKIILALKNSKKWKNQYEFLSINKNVNPSFFGFPIIISEKYKKLKKKLLKKLESLGIESRPIISGNFLNQPAAKLFKFKQKAKDFPNSQIIEERGFFIGLHAKPISSKNLNFLVESLLSISYLK